MELADEKMGGTNLLRVLDVSAGDRVVGQTDDLGGCLFGIQPRA